MVYPRASYLVCGTPRSGTSLLCDGLKSTGIAGRPEEYFWRDNRPFWQERWGVSTDADFLWSVLQEGTTPNGVFGAKVMWGYFDDVLALLRNARRAPDRPASLLAAAFPHLRYIHVRRRDRIRQAVSWEIAHQTGIWYEAADSPGRRTALPTYNRSALDALARMIEEHECAWEQYFRGADVTPLVVEYEDLAANYGETIRTALDFLRLTLPAGAEIPPPRLRKQASELSEAWVRRYEGLE